MSNARTSIAAWVFLVVVAAIAVVVEAAFTRNWAVAVGFILVPTIIGYFVLRKSSPRAPAQFVLRCLGAIVVFGLLLFQGYKSALTRTSADMQNVCKTNNAFVATLSQESQDKYCSCIAGRSANIILWKEGAAYLLQSSVEPMEDSDFVAAMTEIVNQCAATVVQ
jgi:hypothetical protein